MQMMVETVFLQEVWSQMSSIRIIANTKKFTIAAPSVKTAPMIMRKKESDIKFIISINVPISAE